MIYLWFSIQALQNDTIIHYSVSGSSSQQCSGKPLKLFVLIYSCSLQELSEAIPNRFNIELAWLSAIKYKPKLSHMALHVILCLMRQKESNMHATGQVDIHLSSLNFMVHKSNYCLCSSAWCQVRTFYCIYNLNTYPPNEMPAPICRYWLE